MGEIHDQIEEEMWTSDYINDRPTARHPNLGVPYIKEVHFLPLREGIVPPKKGTPDSAGYDLCAAEDISIDAHRTGLVKLGFSTAMPSNIHGRIESRSGMALKGYVVLTGVIDADYRGEWGVILHNLTDEQVHIAKGDRVAQCVFRPTVSVSFRPSDTLEASERGAGGFGSTGR